MTAVKLEEEERRGEGVKKKGAGARARARVARERPREGVWGVVEVCAEAGSTMAFSLRNSSYAAAFDCSCSAICGQGSTAKKPGTGRRLKQRMAGPNLILKDAPRVDIRLPTPSRLGLLRLVGANPPSLHLVVHRLQSAQQNPDSATVGGGRRVLREGGQTAKDCGATT